MNDTVAERLARALKLDPEAIPWVCKCRPLIILDARHVRFCYECGEEYPPSQLTLPTFVEPSYGIH